MFGRPTRHTQVEKCREVTISQFHKLFQVNMATVHGWLLSSKLLIEVIIHIHIGYF